MSRLYLLLTKINKKFLFALLFLGMMIYPIYHGLKIASIGAVYKAKLLCTNTFFAGRIPVQVLKEDLSGPEIFIFTRIDYSNKSVTAWFPGITKQQAFYLQGLGCVWSANIDEKQFRIITNKWNADLISHPVTVKNARFSEDFKHPAFNQQHLKTAIDKAFSEQRTESLIRTRAILIVYQGQLVAERYAPGITSTTPLQGWSMTKSVINALIGILVKQGKLSLVEKALIQEWSGADDPRASITLDQLLRMSSGLEFNETVEINLTDLTEMLFQSPDTAAFALDKPLKYLPDTHWQYSSGTSNIIALIARLASGGSTADVVKLLRDELLTPLGMHKAIIEPDSSGNLIGSSYMYATARDWARFGQLYLQDGMWDGKRLLPESWVKYSSTPTAASKGEYGAHFWTNGGSKSSKQNRPFPNLPADLYFAAGYKNQRLIIIPSQQLVIIRLGWSDDASSSQYMNTLVVDILNAKIN